MLTDDWFGAIAIKIGQQQVLLVSEFISICVFLSVFPATPLIQNPPIGQRTITWQLQIQQWLWWTINESFLS